MRILTINNQKIRGCKMFNFDQVKDYNIHINGEVTTRATVLAIDNLLLDMDNFIILTSK